MLGGRILGQGTYGCVFQPALVCRGKKRNIGETMVGKITSKRDAKNELEISEMLHAIPDFKNYTIPVEKEKCSPRAKSKQQEKDIQKCDLSKELDLEDSIQLLMPWGGYPLSRINLDPYVFDFFRFTEEILAIGTFMVLHNLSHFDVWGQNFLFDKTNKPKLIDFGFAFQGTQLKLSDLSNRWREFDTGHDTETPEVTLMLGVHKHIPVHQIIRGLERDKPAVLRLQAFCGVNPVHWSGELYQWTKDSVSFQEHDWLTCWKVYWPGFDAWSIGALLLSVLEIQMAIPAFVNSNAWKEKGPLLKSVLVELCRGHPAQRLDAAEALSVFSGGTHPLISSGSAGSDWALEKKQNRKIPL